MVDFGYQLLAIATIAAHVLSAVMILAFFMRKSKGLGTRLFLFFKEKAFDLHFLAVLTAMIGSLFFSEIAKFAPCILCWYQRIAMYPQVVISYVAILKNEQSTMKWYLLPLNLVGLLVSLYHNFILWFPQYGAMLNCSTKGGPSCIEGYKFYFGYVTIPLMAFTVFLFNIIVLTMYMQSSQASKK